MARAKEDRESKRSRDAIVSFAVRDLDRARAFYADRLGFRVLRDEAGEFVMVDAGGVALCLDLPRGKRRPRGGGTTLILRERDIAGRCRALRRGGVAFVRGGRAPRNWISLRDPDGHEIVFARSL